MHIDTTLPAIVTLSNAMILLPSPLHNFPYILLVLEAPFGQGPLLVVDGKVLWQSVACQRYVADLVELGGKTNEEKIDIDMIAETIWDLRCCKYYY